MNRQPVPVFHFERCPACHPAVHPKQESSAPAFAASICNMQLPCPRGRLQQPPSVSLCSSSKAMGAMTILHSSSMNVETLWFSMLRTGFARTSPAGSAIAQPTAGKHWLGAAKAALCSLSSLMHSKRPGAQIKMSPLCFPDCFSPFSTQNLFTLKTTHLISIVSTTILTTALGTILPHFLS